MKKLGEGVSFSAYRSREMVAYVLLSLPAMVLETLFSSAIATNPNLSSLGTRLGPAGQIVVLVLTVVPWFIVLGSVAAVVLFRSSLVLTLLVVSYFFLSVVQGSVAGAGALSLSPGATAGGVVVSTFLALIAFGFARSAKIRGANPPRVRTRGSTAFQIMGISLDFAVPAVIAVVLVVVTIEMFGAVKSALADLPPPLSGVFSSTITSPVAAAGITLIVAGITLWMVRELIEPWVMYYSITQGDAVRLLKDDLKTVSRPGEISNRRSFRGTALTVLVIAVILAVLVVSFGPGSVMAGIPTVFGSSPVPDKSFVLQTNQEMVRIQNLINTIVGLLWG